MAKIPPKHFPIQPRPRNFVVTKGIFGELKVAEFDTLGEAEQYADYHKTYAIEAGSKAEAEAKYIAIMEVVG